MNDKQKLALKELADVMEKHCIAVAGHDRGVFAIIGEFEISFEGFESDRDMDAEYIRNRIAE